LVSTSCDKAPVFVCDKAPIVSCDQEPVVACDHAVVSMGTRSRNGPGSTKDSEKSYWEEAHLSAALAQTWVDSCTPKDHHSANGETSLADISKKDSEAAVRDDCISRTCQQLCCSLEATVPTATVTSDKAPAPAPALAPTPSPVLAPALSPALAPSTAPPPPERCPVPAPRVSLPALAPSAVVATLPASPAPAAVKRTTPAAASTSATIPVSRANVRRREFVVPDVCDGEDDWVLLG